MLDNKSILITGGTGSFGREFVKTVLGRFHPRKLVVFSRDELKQFEMRQLFPDSQFPCMRYFIGDVRDYPRLEFALKDIDIVIHAAALKQVPTAEYNPFETIKTNVVGTQNVIDAALAANVERVIGLSTDKAAAPTNLYGATKLAADKLFVAANNYTGTATKFSIVRYGNVMGSRGSVIPMFMARKETGVFPVTDERMTRFNISLDRGVNFVLQCLERMWGGEIFVPKLPSYRITDVAEAICPECQIEIVGIRPGEKLHEQMITEFDSPYTLAFDDHYVITPNSDYCSWNIDMYREQASEKPAQYCSPDFCYDSGTNEQFLTVPELRRLIAENVK